MTEQQIIIAAEITNQSPDFGQLEPMVTAALRELESAGVSERPRTVLADAGYWHKKQMEHLLADGFQVVVPPDSMVRQGARPGWEGGVYSFMRRVLLTDLGRELYERRRRSIEPVFGRIKHNRGMTRFRRRGRAAARHRMYANGCMNAFRARVGSRSASTRSTPRSLTWTARLCDRWFHNSLTRSRPPSAWR